MQSFYEQLGLWKPEDPDIWIGYLNGNTLIAPSPKPAIIVQRGQVRFLNKGGIGGRAERNLYSGSQVYMDLINGSVIIRCIECTPALADKLAQDVFSLFGFLRQMTKDFGFFNIDYDSVMLGEPVQLKGSVRPDDYSVPVTFSASVQVRWDVTPDGHTLQGVTIRS